MSSNQSNMSWLGSGLSQITGQISNFTKEVLTEGTEEVDDHATELRVARGRLLETESQYQAARAELERVKKINEELTDKLHSSELHTNSLSTEYRDKLTEQEREIQQLKQQHHAVLEAQSKVAVADTPISHLYTSTSAPHLHAFGGDEHDFDDIVSGQSEINRLQREVERLSAECRHWKQVANVQRGTSQQLPSGNGTTSDDNVADLHSRIKALERQLSSEIDDHQNELAALQNLHTSKLAAQGRKLAEEKDKLQSKIDELEDHILQMGSSGDNLNIVDELKELRESKDQLSLENDAANKRVTELLREVETLRQKVASYDESVIEGDANSAWKPELVSSTPRRPIHSLHAHDTMELSFSELSETNKQLNDEMMALRQQVSIYQQEVSQFDLVRSDLVMEKEALESVLVNLRAKLKDKEEQMAVRQAEKGLQELARHQGEAEDDDDMSGEGEVKQPSELNLGELSRQLELLTEGNSMLENERDNLQEEKEELQQKVNELESQVTKLFAADAKCLRLQAELDEKITDLDSLRSQVAQQDDQLGKFSSNYDESFESIIEKEAEIAELEEKVQALEQENELLVEDRSRHLSDEDVDTEIRRMREELREKNKQIEYLQGQEKQLKYVTVELEEREASFRDVDEERKRLETNIDELDAQQQDAIAAVMESKEKLAKANEKLKQRTKELEAEIANLSQSQDFEGEAAELQEELAQAQGEVERLQEEKTKREIGWQDLKVKLDESAIALNDLHMDKQELEKVVKELKQKVANITSEKRQLETSQSKLEMQLHQTHEKLQAVTTKTQIQSGLQSDLLRLRDELDASQLHAVEHVARMESLEKEVSTLQDQLNTSIVREEQLQSQTEELQKSKDEEIETLRKEVSRLTSIKSKLENEIVQVSDRMKEQAQRYEDYIKDINTAKELDANSLEENYRKVMEENHQKDVKISELEVRVEQLKIETEDLQGQLQNAMEGQQDAVTLLADKEAEVTALQAQTQALQEYAEDKASALKSLQDGKSETLDDASTGIIEKNNELQNNVSELEKELFSKDQQIQSYESDNQRLNATLTEQTTEFEMERLKYSQETEAFTEKIQVLELTINTKDGDLSEALESLKLAKCESNGHVETEGGNKENLQSVNLVNNRDVIPTLEDREDMSRLLTQKDDVIRELRNNNQSLLKLLEERSFQLHGNRSLVDIHKLQNELKGLQMEKEQIMSVLNDKSRECSNLKSEVHKLMNVISAEKSALSKLQKDNQELLKTQGSPKKGDVNPDMTREAIKNLSMVIRDKDLEIESLTQKNQTLLQVMQQNPEGGAQMTTILQERENLMKQLEQHQKGREQIIAMLTQKHQESVAYHNEIQRLMNLSNENVNKHEKLEEDFSSLQQQYEDKQQALLKIQNELLNYKQKFSEVDSKYKEMLHRQAQQVQKQVQQPPPLPSPKPKTTEENGKVDQEVSQGSETNDTNDAQYQQHISHINNLVQQKKDEITQLTEQIHQLRLALQERDRGISEIKRNLSVKEQVIKDKETVINARNQAISEANARVREAHEQMRKKDMDISSLRKQIDNMTFQARGLQTELNDLKLERDNAMHRMEGILSERTQLAEANARLSAAIGERDLEMNAMREKTATLTAAVREVGAEKGEVEQMLADTEAMQKAAQVLQAERDQAYASLQAVQADNTAIKQQGTLVAEREQKLQRELERLRSHLLTIEEGYTQEALAAEEREKALRNRLASAEEHAAHSSNAVQNYSVEATRQTESLHEQLTVIAEQRDHALLQLSSASDTASQYAASLTNLQMVLEQFQTEREEQQSVETERYQRDLATRTQQLIELQEHNRSLQVRVDETTDALEAAQRLSEQLDRKEEAMVALKEEVLLREEELTKAENEIQQLNTSSEAKVDKLIIKNLIVGYFHTASNKRHEVLTLLGKVLNFSHDEMVEVGATNSEGGWLKGMFRRTVGTVATPPTTPNRTTAFDKSFSEMFVKFLERESSPQPSMRLPAEAMAREQQEKQRNKPPAFNPFSMPAASAVPAGQAAPAPADSHILMKPMAGELPMFSAIVPSAGGTAATTSGTREPASKAPPSGRLSAASSGRSTPASMILKDVLQQQ